MTPMWQEVAGGIFAVVAFAVAMFPAWVRADLFVPGQTYQGVVQFCGTLDEADATALAIVNGGPNGAPACKIGRLAFETLHAVKEHRKGLILTRVYEVKELATESKLYVIVISLIDPPRTYRFT